MRPWSSSPPASGAGTGTGSAPVVAKSAREEGALTIAVVTLPFTAEGAIRAQNAEAGLERLREVADTVIVVPNDRLLEVVPRLPLHAAFKVSDEVLMRAVKGITELITTPGAREPRLRRRQDRHGAGRRRDDRYG